MMHPTAISACSESELHASALQSQKGKEALDSWRAYAGYSCGGNEDYIDVSEHQLERRFTIAVGVSPRTYIRVRRFNDALRLMKTRRYSTLASIAYELNFADRSHFIRDLKAFSRVTPKGLSERAEQFQTIRERHRAAALPADPTC